MSKGASAAMAGAATASMEADAAANMAARWAVSWAGAESADDSSARTTILAALRTGAVTPAGRHCTLAEKSDDDAAPGRTAETTPARVVAAAAMTGRSKLGDQDAIEQAADARSRREE